jgi:hypothetical protein
VYFFSAFLAEEFFRGKIVLSEEGVGKESMKKQESMECREKTEALELLFGFNSKDLDSLRPTLIPFNKDPSWSPSTHRYYPKQFKDEVRILLLCKKRCGWLYRDVLVLIIKALAKLHRYLQPNAISWTVPKGMLGELPGDPFNPFNLPPVVPPIQYPIPYPYPYMVNPVLPHEALNLPPHLFGQVLPNPTWYAPNPAAAPYPFPPPAPCSTGFHMHLG